MHENTNIRDAVFFQVVLFSMSCLVNKSWIDRN